MIESPEPNTEHRTPKTYQTTTKASKNTLTEHYVATNSSQDPPLSTRPPTIYRTIDLTPFSTFGSDQHRPLAAPRPPRSPPPQHLAPVADPAPRRRPFPTPVIAWAEISVLGAADHRWTRQLGSVRRRYGARAAGCVELGGGIRRSGSSGAGGGGYLWRRTSEAEVRAGGSSLPRLFGDNTVWFGGGGGDGGRCWRW